MRLDDAQGPRGKSGRIADPPREAARVSSRQGVGRGSRTRPGGHYRKGNDVRDRDRDRDRGSGDVDVGVVGEACDEARGEIRLPEGLPGGPYPCRYSWWPEHRSGLSSVTTGQGTETHAASIDALAFGVVLSERSCVLDAGVGVGVLRRRELRSSKSGRAINERREERRYWN